jgi:ATP-dependent Clp protease ATP-binding subunit ClpC
VFERFTERARQVVVLAQDEARALKHNYIGTEHLLLGLLREQEGIAARVLEQLGVELDSVRERVRLEIGEGEELRSGQIPFTPKAKKVLELSLREALSLGHEYIGTEHLLLGLVRVHEGLAARTLADVGATAERIREGVVGLLGGPPGQAGRQQVTMVPGRHPRPRRAWPIDALLAGWALFGVAAGLGLLVGWLIWG